MKKVEIDKKTKNLKNNILPLIQYNNIIHKTKEQ